MFVLWVFFFSLVCYLSAFYTQDPLQTTSVLTKVAMEANETQNTEGTALGPGTDITLLLV